jgi:tetratricopeptide (TPR) repeat protein
MFCFTGRPNFRLLWALALLLTPLAVWTQSGGGVDFTGTNGRHTIQGRIFLPSGRAADRRLKVRLESTNSGALSVLTDTNGAFSFRGLSPGSYTLIVEGENDFETYRETFFIDTEPKSRAMRSPTIPRSITIPIHLQPKRSSEPAAKPGVVNAALAGVAKPAAELYLKALEAARAGATDKAIEQLRAALVLAPDFALAWNELGVQYLKQGQAGKAAEALEKAVALTPESFSPRLNYGIALLEKGDAKGAETHLRQALAKNESSWTVRLYLGLAMIKLRRYDEAEQELLQAVKLGGAEVGLPHYYLGGLYWRKGEYQRAAEALTTYLKLTPNAPEAEKIRNTIKELRNKG